MDHKWLSTMPIGEILEPTERVSFPSCPNLAQPETIYYLFLLTNQFKTVTTRDLILHFSMFWCWIDDN